MLACALFNNINVIVVVNIYMQSEDDGMGGRRKKKGIKDKIKDKLTGGHNKEGEHQQQQAAYGGPAGYGSTAATGGEQHHGHEKKGMMEKIKEKLPGGGGGGHNY